MESQAMRKQRGSAIVGMYSVMVAMSAWTCRRCVAATADGRRLPPSRRHVITELQERNVIARSLVVHSAFPLPERAFRFTVTRLGITDTLARTLTTSDPIESMISIARATNRKVTHWRDGQMVLRWTAAGMLNAERSFRRVKGYKQMPTLITALSGPAHPNTAHRPETVGTAA
jgi:hypothetical protein